MSGPVQTNSNSSGVAGSSIAVTFNSAVTAGNLLVCYVGTGGHNPTSYTISDNVNPGNWANDLQLVSSNAEFCVASLPGTLVGTPTVTCTFGNSTPVPQIIIEEWAGVVTSSAFDQSQHNDNNGTSVTSTATGSLIQASELVLGVAATGINGETYVAGGGFTLGTQVPSGAGAGTLASEWTTVSSTNPVTATFTIGTNVGWSCGVVTYKLAPVGSPVNLMGAMCL